MESKTTRNTARTVLLVLALMASTMPSPFAWAGNADLSWNANTEPDLAGYRIYYGTSPRSSAPYSNLLDVGLTATPGAPARTLTNLADGYTYYFAVTAYDTSGNESGYSVEVSKALPLPDTSPPSVPSSMTASPVSSSQINLSWSASTDSGGSGLAGYRIERCAGSGCGNFAEIGVTSQTTYGDTGLAAGTVYAYRVRAYDNAGNNSGYSSTASATTQPPSDVTAPSVPGALTGVAASPSQVNLSWSASTDSGGSGLAGYRIERCAGSGCGNFAEIAVTSQTTYSDNGLLAGTAYVYRVRAYDIAGNNSGYSNTAAVTTPAANLAPTANAGPDQTVWTGTLVTLDGTGSVDPEGQPLTASWSQASGPSMTLSDPGTMNPTFTPSVAGTYVLNLTVSDGVNTSAPDAVNIVANEPINHVPTANAGIDQAVLIGSEVLLDGSMSVDPDGDPLAYAWSQTAGPAVSLQNVSSAAPSFDPPSPAAYEFRLVVSDGKADSPPDSVSVVVNGVNSVPVADAGVDRTVRAGDVVTLNGDQSSDADGDPLTFSWKQTGGPAVTLSDPADPHPTFTAGPAGNLEFTLTVNDGQADSPPDTVNITVNEDNSVPLADAGADQTGRAGSPVTLDGSGSRDPDGDPLTFSWSQFQGPSVVLSDRTREKPSFTPALSGTYGFQLVVSDGQLQSLPDQVWVTVNGDNQVPVSNAGPDQIVETGSLVTLDGSLSADGDEDPLAYAWTQEKGTPVSVAAPGSEHPQFFPADTKTVTFDLFVNDGADQSAPDTVSIYVMDKVYTKRTISSDSGGSLSVPDGDLAGLRLDFPPGALASDRLIGIGQDFNLPPLNGKKFIGLAASFEPAGTTFQKPVSVVFPYDPSQYKNTNQLKAYLYDDALAKWVQVPIVAVDEANGLVTAEITHFSSLALTVDEPASGVSHSISGGFGCGAIMDIPRDKGSGPPVSGDLLLLLGLMAWLARGRGAGRPTRTTVVHRPPWPSTIVSNETRCSGESTARISTWCIVLIIRIRRFRLAISPTFCSMAFRSGLSSTTSSPSSAFLRCFSASRMERSFFSFRCRALTLTF
jgi:fibronectin type 3 domain-containing protein